VAGDAGEAVGARVQQHELEHQALALLQIGPLGDRLPGSAHALGELVTHTLELAEIEQAWLAGRAVWLLESTHRIGGDERVGELALKPGDLRAQRAPGCALNPLSLARFTAKRGRRI